MDIPTILNECQFKAVRSSGAGGQHVNKVASKVELQFDLENSQGLSDFEKSRLKQKLASKLTQDSFLLLQAGDTRSQHRNKQLVISRFLMLLKDGLKVPKKRKATAPTRASVAKRLDSKQKNAVKKQLRKKPKLD